MSLLHLQKYLVISSDGITATSSPPTFFDGTNAIAATRWSQPVLVRQFDKLSLQVSTPVGATLVAAITMEGSNDVGKQDGNGQPDVTLLNWAPLSFFDEATSANVVTKSLASGAQTFMFTIATLGVRWWRMKETFTSGSALLTAAAQFKGTSGK